MSYFHSNDKSLQWWKLHWKKQHFSMFFTDYSWLYTIGILLWWLMQQSPYHIYSCVYCLVEIFPKTNQLLGYLLPYWLLNFGSVYLKDERCVECPRFWAFFGTHIICVKNAIPNHHFTKLEIDVNVFVVSIDYVCVNVQFDLFSIHPNWFVEYPSRLVGFCPSTVLQSSIVQMQSPGPTNAFAHIAADQIESWSNPPITFWRFMVGTPCLVFPCPISDPEMGIEKWVPDFFLRFRRTY